MELITGHSAAPGSSHRHAGCAFLPPRFGDLGSSGLHPFWEPWPETGPSVPDGRGGARDAQGLQAVSPSFLLRFNKL